MSARNDILVNRLLSAWANDRLDDAVVGKPHDALLGSSLGTDDGSPLVTAVGLDDGNWFGPTEELMVRRREFHLE
ncbi:MAG: hypothetical protein ACREOZ_04710 [Gloeomargaritales cyanobacterium]